jgi:hypothetical protein
MQPSNRLLPISDRRAWLMQGAPPSRPEWRPSRSSDGFSGRRGLDARCAAQSTKALHGAGVKRAVPALVYLIAAGLLAGCAPLIHVENKSGIGVRAAVEQGKPPKLFTEVLRLPPNAGRSVVAVEGIYRVFAAPDRAWGAYITGVRRELEQQLQDPKNLTPDQIRVIKQRLDNLLQDFERSATAELKFGFCRGSVGNSEDDVRVQIAALSNGVLALSCGSSAKKAAPPK